MLKKRIITTLLFDESLQCVKPIQFERPYRRLGPLEQYMNVVEQRNVDELLLIDITATEQNRKPNFEFLKYITGNVYAPVTYGGGIASLEHIKEALASGADKVAIKTHHNLVYFGSRRFGSQAIVFVMDRKPDDGNTFILNECKVRELEGAGEILLTDIDHDGIIDGYNINLVRMISNDIAVPIIVQGGCCGPPDMYKAFKAGASACAVGSLFLYTDYTPKRCAKELKDLGIETRLDHEVDATRAG